MLIRCGVTTNCGVEKFAAQEAHVFLQGKDVNISQGFVMFTCPETKIEDILSMRTIERAYVEIGFVGADAAGQFKDKALDECCSTISDCVTEDSWEQGVLVWREATKCELKSPDFRVSCKRMGGKSKHMKSPDIGKNVGIAIRKHFGWNVNLNDYEAEVYIRVTDEFVFVGLTLTPERLTDRKDQLIEGLRGSVAFAMAMLAGILPQATPDREEGDQKKASSFSNGGLVVLDPMCGKGALLLEAHRCGGGNAIFLGSDTSNAQLRSAVHNVVTTHTSSHIQLMKSDATNLPLFDNFVDVIICDLPFGKKFGSIHNNKTLYPKLMAEFCRVLKKPPSHPTNTSSPSSISPSIRSSTTVPSSTTTTCLYGRAALLTSKKMVQLLESACKRGGLKVESQHKLKLGNLDTCILVVAPLDSNSVPVARENSSMGKRHNDRHQQDNASARTTNPTKIHKTTTPQQDV
eukprot:m.18265 g.18265  ORF g.18265 m.18265 type:complete len:461 (+) comp4938_c0_seq1:94-1476(+)